MHHGSHCCELCPQSCTEANSCAVSVCLCNVWLLGKMVSMRNNIRSMTYLQDEIDLTRYLWRDKGLCAMNIDVSRYSFVNILLDTILTYTAAVNEQLCDLHNNICSKNDVTKKDDTAYKLHFSVPALDCISQDEVLRCSSKKNRFHTEQIPLRVCAWPWVLQRF